MWMSYEWFKRHKTTQMDSCFWMAESTFQMIVFFANDFPVRILSSGAPRQHQEWRTFYWFSEAFPLAFKTDFSIAELLFNGFQTVLILLISSTFPASSMHFSPCCLSFQKLFDFCVLKIYIFVIFNSGAPMLAARLLLLVAIVHGAPAPNKNFLLATFTCVVNYFEFKQSFFSDLVRYSLGTRPRLWAK